MRNKGLMFLGVIALTGALGLSAKPGAPTLKKVTEAERAAVPPQTGYADFSSTAGGWVSVWLPAKGQFNIGSSG